MSEFGFFRVVTPFLLIFALMYGILLHTKVLGDVTENAWVRNVAAIISLATAFLVISYTPVVDALSVLIPQASFLLVVVLFLIMN